MVTVVRLETCRALTLAKVPRIIRLVSIGSHHHSFKCVLNDCAILAPPSVLALAPTGFVDRKLRHREQLALLHGLVDLVEHLS